ncbi:MAG: response regulator [Lachnospiraceae bacterium]|nr:response regulator [Lachnospiraceae bacterium]
MEPPLGFKNQTAKGDFYVIPVYLEQYRLDIIISVNADFVAGEKPEKTGSVVKTVTDAEAGTGNANILIVDDSRMSREMLRNILEKAGYNVVGEAANGEEGVEAYKKLKPDVVTMDITMPQKDGLQALKEILAFDADARIVMITAAGQQDKLIQALKEGAKRFINKPFNEVEITVNIKDVLK